MASWKSKVAGKLKRDKHPKGGESEYGEFEIQRENFKKLKKQLNRITSDLKKYEKAVKGIVGPLQELSKGLDEFYEESATQSEFVMSTEIIADTIGDFENEISVLTGDIAAYEARVTAYKKQIGERDKLFADFKNKQKAHSSAKEDKAAAAKLKLDDAKEAFEEYNIELQNNLEELCQNRNNDFQNIYEGLQESQSHLFTKMSTAFNMNASSSGGRKKPSRPKVTRQPEESLSRSDSSEEAYKTASSTPPGQYSSASGYNAAVPAPSRYSAPAPTPEPYSAPVPTPQTYTAPAPTPGRPAPAMPARDSPTPSRPATAPHRPTSAPQRPRSVPPGVRVMPVGGAGGYGRPKGAVKKGYSPKKGYGGGGPKGHPKHRMAHRGKGRGRGRGRGGPKRPVQAPGRPGGAPPRPGQPAPGVRDRSYTAPGNASPPARPTTAPQRPAAAPQRPTAAPQRPAAAPQRPAAYNTPTSKWTIPDSELQKYSAIFRREDPTNSGLISGAKAAQLFSRSNLDEATLALIWEIADQNKDGQLDVLEFTVAMFVINGLLRKLLPSVPTVVPPELTVDYANGVIGVSASPAPSGPPARPSSTYGSAPPPRPGQSYGGQYGASGGDMDQYAQNMEDKANEYAHEMELKAQQEIGKQVGNQAMDKNNQVMVGNAIADNTSNPVAKKLARNRFVQKQVGKGVSQKANDPKTQQKASNKMKKKGMSYFKK